MTVLRARPTWEPLQLRCGGCETEWDDWQPFNVPVATWLAHGRGLRCPRCRSDDAPVYLRLGVGGPKCNQ